MENTKPNRTSALRHSMATALMLLTVLLAGSDCQESEANRSSNNDYTQIGPHAGSTTRGGPGASGEENPAADRGGDDLDEFFERGSYTPADDPKSGEEPPVGEEPLGDPAESAQSCLGDGGCAADQDCVAGTCVESGPLRISLYWSEATDIDLHILTPTGEKLWYRNRNTSDGGLLASDSCIGGACELNGGAIVESAHWKDEPTRGEYEVWALNYSGAGAVEVNFEILVDGVVTTYRGTVGAEAGAESQRFQVQYPGVEEEERNAGRLIGEFVHTYYYLANETEYTGSANTTLYDSQCRPLATVPSAFADSACIEGSGKLRDGTVINYATTCSCGRRCPTGGTVCYSILDATRFPWGKGNRNNPLEPFRSIAVDRNVIANGTIVYMEEWDGVAIPAVDGIGGFVHDGCFRADDVGGGIRGRHYDFFAATKDMWRALERVRPTRTTSKVYVESERCAHFR